MIRLLKARYLKKLRQKNEELKGRLQAMQIIVDYKDTMIKELSHKLNESAIELDNYIEKFEAAEYECKLYKKVIKRALDRHSTLPELLEVLEHEKSHEK